MKGKTVLLLFLAGLGLAALTIKSAVRWGGTPLPVFSELPGFSLIDQTGQPFSLRDLTKTAAVVDFVFTQCQGPCPMMALEMGKIQNRFANSAGIRFVSISVDPANDTPPVLTEYAEMVGATSGKWIFLTGVGDSIVALSEQGFKLPASTWPVEHTTRFVLVDKRGQIRGYYDSVEEESMKTLIEDIDKLLRSKEG